MNTAHATRTDDRLAGVFTSVTLALVLALLVGCQADGPTRPETGADATPRPDAHGEQSAGDAAALLQQAIADLDAGRIERAEQGLRDLLKRRPDSPLAERLLAQIHADPIERFGPDYYEITVAPGDTLSAIALRELGDSLLFFAVARYNRIDAPRHLQPGRVLRIPERLKAEAEHRLTGGSSSPERADEAALAEGPVETARHMLADGQLDQALVLLRAVAQTGRLGVEDEAILVEATLLKADAVTSEHGPGAAVALIDEVGQWLSDEALAGLRPARDRAQARVRYQQAEEQRRLGDLERTLELLNEAVVLDATFQPARVQAGRVRGLLIGQLHERALQQYRDQRLDQAIMLWERVGELDAGFEPARLYLERARALRERLAELDRDGPDQ